jgi:hypothetical protein
VSQHCFDTVVGALECGELYLALDENAEITESLFEQALGLGLWEHQRVGIGALHATHVDAAYDLVACDEVYRSALNPASTKGADPPPRSSNSRVLLHRTRALDLSVRCAALSTMRTVTP